MAALAIASGGMIALSSSFETKLVGSGLAFQHEALEFKRIARQMINQPYTDQ